MDQTCQPTIDNDVMNETELDNQLAAIPPHSVLVVHCGWLPQQISMGNDAKQVIAAQMGVPAESINTGSYKIFDWTDRKNPNFKFLQELRGHRDQMAQTPRQFATPQFSAHFKAELKNLVSPTRLAGMSIIADNRLSDFETEWDKRWVGLQGCANKFVDNVWDPEKCASVNMYAELREYHKNVAIQEAQWPYVERRFPSADECRERILSTCYNLTPVSRNIDYAGMSTEIRLQLKQKTLEQFQTTCSQGLALLTSDFTELMKRISRATGQKSRFNRDPENRGLRNAEIIDLEQSSENPEIPEGHIFVTYCKAKQSEKRDGYIRDGEPVKELWSIDRYNNHQPVSTGEYAKLSPSVFRDFDEVVQRFSMVGSLLQDDGTVEQLISGVKDQLSNFGRNPDAIASYLKSNTMQRRQISDLAAQFQQKGMELQQRNKVKRKVNRGGASR